MGESCSNLFPRDSCMVQLISKKYFILTYLYQTKRKKKKKKQANKQFKIKISEYARARYNIYYAQSVLCHQFTDFLRCKKVHSCIELTFSAKYDYNLHTRIQEIQR